MNQPESPTPLRRSRLAPHRRAMLAGTVLLVGGSLAATIGYGVRLRSDSYRRTMEAWLSAFFKLPCDVGTIRPMTFSSRAFGDVSLWLADRRARVFHCERAVWHELEDNRGEYHNLDLYGGTLSVASDRWSRDDYARVLESGIGHDFAALRLGEVRLHDFQLEFRHPRFALACGQADGVMSFERPNEGVARITAGVLNGVATVEPAQVIARFSPQRGVDIRQLVLTVPEVPLAAVGIDAALGARTTRGRFAGRIEYRDETGEPELWVAGRLADVALAEVTRGLPFGPIRGSLDVSIDAARIEDGLVTALLGRGEIRGVRLTDFAPLLGRERLAGQADLNLRSVDLERGHANRLVVDGTLTGVSLEELSSLLGRGRATGTLTVAINALRVVNDVIEWAEIEIAAVPPPGAAEGTVDRTLLLGSAQRLLDFTWPESLPQSILPERIEYVEFGMRLVIVRNRMRILGTHGSRGERILTVRVFGTEIGLVRSLRREVDLTPYLAALREQFSTRDPREMREWWERRKPKLGMPGDPPRGSDDPTDGSRP